MRRFAVITAVMSATLVATPALATKLVGKIIVTKEFRESLKEGDKPAAGSRLEGYWNQPNGIIPVQPPRVDPSRDLGVVIFKEGAKPPGPDKLTTVKVRTGSMERNVIVTRPKSTLRLRSVDPFDHELYSPEVKGFIPERQAEGAFRPLELPKEGIYHIRCKLMPHFNAYVVVTNATYVVEVDRKGKFKLDELEPGDYTLKVFHGGKWVHEQKFEVTDEKKKKEVELEVKLSGKAAPKSDKDEQKKGEQKEAKTDKGDTKKSEKKK
jgi:hypothetical protein